MRRTLPVLLAATLLFAACSSDDSNDDNATDQTTVSTDAEDTSTSEAPDGTDPAASPTNPDKPTVDIPEEIPTELQVTVLEEGSGPVSEAGDTVIVDYVGVRSRDGVEFDNSYDRFQPFDVVVGTGSVIEGWDQGLTGVQAGSTVQLDIPSDLAYGPNANGDIIGENEALTFLIEVRAVIQPPDPADEPTEAGVPASEGATDTTFVDLREGEGPELQAGQTAVINYVLFRGDNLVALESSWANDPVQVSTASNGGFPGFTEGLPGMKVGGRRAIIIPPEDAFGPDGNPELGLPAGSDMIVVVDLLGFFGTPE
jgi:peptidylprolyl isomerase